VLLDFLEVELVRVMLSFGIFFRVSEKERLSPLLRVVFERPRDRLLELTDEPGEDALRVLENLPGSMDLLRRASGAADAKRLLRLFEELRVFTLFDDL
jgi:hypothetical protein